MCVYCKFNNKKRVILMKTNQMMKIDIFGGILNIEHLTGFGSLTDVFNIGNVSRVQSGKKPAQLAQFIKRSATVDFIAASSKAWGGEEMIKVTGKGNKRQTMAHISLLIYAAEYLSPDFHAHIIKTFIQDRILEHRDQSGDYYSIVNSYIDSHLPGRSSKDNKGIYISIAKMIKKIINPDGGGWNTANANQLRSRTDIEKKIITVLELEVVNDWDHLKQIISKFI